MPYNAMKNRAFVPEEKFMREALSLAVSKLPVRKYLFWNA